MKISLTRWMALLGSSLAFAQGCAHMERAEYDPCARQAERRNKNAGVQIISCRLFHIPFRAQILDAGSGEPIASAAAVNCTNVLGEAADDGPVVAMSTDSGLIEGEVDTFTDVGNPWNNECFRHSFRGILVEICKDGYSAYRGYVPLPPAEGDVAELGVIRLEAKQERTK
ncbi:MAG: hypothetical protein JNK74_10920 [Candidatus Hydrogenedentes bacterium]|nr:hypothetical protein [Candidatus Hydrogenedentota bacterium]